MLIPRLINPKQIRKHFFCLSAAILTLVNLLLMLYSWDIGLRYSDDILKALYLKRSAEIDSSFRFDELGVDRSGRYIINQNVNTGLRKISKYSVTLLTHCTLNNLIYLPRLIKNWDGPVSVAVFIDSLDDFSLILKAFAICNLDIVHSANFHVIRPLDKSFLNNKFLLQDLQMTGLFDNPSALCYKFEVLLHNLNEIRMNYVTNVFYPSNLLRNVANDGAATKFVLNLDIDMLPSKNLLKVFSSFIDSRSKSSESHENTAYILPAFEIEPSHLNLDRVFPMDKSSLLRFVQKNVARPFYHSICDHCQNRTDYVRWMSLQLDSVEPLSASAAYNVSWNHGYEPFFIALRDTVPRFDEHFKQYGYNRVSQLCEMHVIGWNFQVLDLLFVVHIGLKNDASSFHQFKEKEMTLNWKLYREFRRRVSLKHPDSHRNCDIPPVYKL